MKSMAQPIPRAQARCLSQSRDRFGPLAHSAPRDDRIQLVKKQVHTPAFIYDERRLAEQLGKAAAARSATGVKVLYSLKPFAIADALRLLAPELDGFSTSSLFESKLAREVLGRDGVVHIAMPGFQPREIDEIDRLCSYVTFNSLGQWTRFRGYMRSAAKVGLRVNPMLPLVADDRYNPCRAHSKLGVPIDDLARAFEKNRLQFNELGGIHFHTNCDSACFLPLLRTVERLDERLSALLDRVSWINVGGGYLLDDAAELSTLARVVEMVQSRHGLDVYFEPGAAIVRDAGYIVASVVDLFPSGGRQIAVLDTTVNHMPEVFEYQFEPEVLDHDDDADHEYLLAGCTCLAGDIFGLYGFHEPLKVGSRVVFPETGAYTTVKSHMFNGVNLPAIYALTETGDLVLKRQSTYNEFRASCGA
jgi:carboxynorspermidine decarboxylase